jgi:hypothetical protein
MSLFSLFLRSDLLLKSQFCTVECQSRNLYRDIALAFHTTIPQRGILVMSNSRFSRIGPPSVLLPEDLLAMMKSSIG